MIFEGGVDMASELYLMAVGDGRYLDWTGPDSRWQILTADDLRREAQKGHQSLKEKYGK